ncbi:sigma-70 family RNA polymerase sigma factor [Kribbella albertanoniae]|uniref:Sigma-70 family RNA polymerase sigma factor n=1 Tax=Kribbella albertanoniae TaxID=1266829 RepID=A0A4R4QEV2_9ACTN|nr:sigma-70 family RNA polymerase sigma factor [Kribbella albertanoniae]TDC34024.1 sigma-70 family RNA polymerase sigma factor [Kribbella albertanoniae]
MLISVDSELGERFHRGDLSALPELYGQFGRLMYVAAYNMLGDRELASDAVQRAFVQAWQGAGGFDPARELKPWLYAITRRAAVDVYRRERRALANVSLDVSWEAEMQHATIASIEDTWQAWQVREALDKLHPDERRVIQLAYFDGFSQSEIARLLNVALGTVKSRTARAQRRLAELLSHLREVESTARKAC